MTSASLTPRFFLTGPTPCPYLPGQQERKIFTPLRGQLAMVLYDQLTQTGFRRSQNVAYRPMCDQCQACIPVRLCVPDFSFSYNMRRILKKNEELRVQALPLVAHQDHYALFCRYLTSRHEHSTMREMSFEDYENMITESPVRSHLNAYYSPSSKLIAMVLVDVLADGLSLVYSFYDPDLLERSLGTFLILDQIRQARVRALPYVYLGYWVEGSRQMAYKSRFKPQEQFGPHGWRRIE